MAKMYTKEHEWIEVSGDVATIGISNYAQEQLGDVIYVELPELGKEVNIGEELAVVESAKSASDIYAPLTGEVLELNQELESRPELVNEDPFSAGWLLKLRIDTFGSADLLDEESYRQFLEGLEDD